MSVARRKKIKIHITFYMATKMIPQNANPNRIFSASQKYPLCHVQERKLPFVHNICTHMSIVE